MRVHLETWLPLEPGDVYRRVETPALLRHVAAPLVTFVSHEKGGFPERWSPGPHRVFMFLFGAFPLGPQTVGIEIGPHSDDVRRIRDNGSGLLARVWDHRIEIRPAPQGGALYSDAVDIEAGLLTPLVWAFAAIFYRWRQHRWRALARKAAG